MPSQGLVISGVPSDLSRQPARSEGAADIHLEVRADFEDVEPAHGYQLQLRGDKPCPAGTRGRSERKRGRSARPLDETVDISNNAVMSKGKPKPTLTDVLRAAIEQSGLTLYRIGNATGMDPSNLGRFARGDLSIRLDKADRLAAYLGLQLVADPKAKPPEPTPENLARPTLAKHYAKREEK